jgi:hypothetical protein
MPRKICWSGYCDRAFKIERFPRPLDSPLKYFFEVSGNIVARRVFISDSVRCLDGASEINSEALMLDLFNS